LRRRRGRRKVAAKAKSEERVRTGLQTTLAREAVLEGVGLHSGAPCKVRLRPARADDGIVFDLAALSSGPSRGRIRACIDSVIDTRLCTRLGNDAGGSIGTVEHLLAAATVIGVDNLLVEIDGDELPILDGSASPYVDALEEAGVASCQAPHRRLRILERVELVDGARSIIAEPYDGALIEVSIDYADPAIGVQTVVLDLSDGESLKRLKRARTFCRLADVEAMRKAGLSRGGSLDNAIVVDGDKILNQSGLRDPQEFALHKALDLIGDLRLAGAPIEGRIVAVRPGHDLNTRFVKRLLERGGACELVPARVSGSGATGEPAGE